MQREPFELTFGAFAAWAFFGPSWFQTEDPEHKPAPTPQTGSLPSLDNKLEAASDWYGKFIESADQVSHRRQQTNNLFLTASLADIAGIGYCISNSLSCNCSQQQHSIYWLAFIMLLCVVGHVLTLIWWSVLRHYQILADSKILVIRAIEDSLAGLYKPFSEHHRLINLDKPEDIPEKEHLSLNRIEQKLADCFGLFFSSVFCGAATILIHIATPILTGKPENILQCIAYLAIFVALIVRFSPKGRVEDFKCRLLKLSWWKTSQF